MMTYRGCELDLLHKVVIPAQIVDLLVTSDEKLSNCCDYSFASQSAHCTAGASMITNIIAPRFPYRVAIVSYAPNLLPVMIFVIDIRPICYLPSEDQICAGLRDFFHKSALFQGCCCKPLFHL